MDMMLSNFFFFFNDTATTEIYTLSLHDALPICEAQWSLHTFETRVNDLIAFDSSFRPANIETAVIRGAEGQVSARRSEEHTSELQSQSNLVCRLLLEKKKK